MTPKWSGDRYEVLVTRYKREHNNDEETRVVSVDVGSPTSNGGAFIVIAVDLDPHGEVIATEVVDTTMTPDEAEGTAERWIDQNPKGIEDGAGIGGLLG